MLKTKVFLVLFLNLFIAVVSWGKGVNVGEVIFADGEAKRRSAQSMSDEENLKRDMDVYEFDQIESQHQAIVRIKLKDQSELTLQDNSLFSIDKYRYHANVPRIFFGKLESGMVYFKSYKDVTKSDKIKIETPFASLKIEGSEFFISIKKLDDQKLSVFQVVAINGPMKIYSKYEKNSISLKTHERYTIYEDLTTHYFIAKKTTISTDQLKISFQEKIQNIEEASSSDNSEDVPNFESVSASAANEVGNGRIIASSEILEAPALDQNEIAKFGKKKLQSLE